MAKKLKGVSDGIVVQGPRKGINRDGDGYLLISTPCDFYIQDDEGRPTGKNYTNIRIEEDGSIVVRVNDEESVEVEQRE